MLPLPPGRMRSRGVQVRCWRRLHSCSIYARVAHDRASCYGGRRCPAAIDDTASIRPPVRVRTKTSCYHGAPRRPHRSRPASPSRVRRALPGYGLGCEAIAPLGRRAGRANMPKLATALDARRSPRPVAASGLALWRARGGPSRPLNPNVQPCEQQDGGHTATMSSRRSTEPAAGPAATRILSAMRCLPECQRKRHHSAGAAARLAARSRRLHKSPTTATARTRHCRTARACR